MALTCQTSFGTTDCCVPADDSAPRRTGRAPFLLPSPTPTYYIRPTRHTHVKTRYREGSMHGVTAVRACVLVLSLRQIRLVAWAAMWASARRGQALSPVLRALCRLPDNLKRSDFHEARAPLPHCAWPLRELQGISTPARENTSNACPYTNTFAFCNGVGLQVGG